MTKSDKKIIKYLKNKYSNNDLISTGFYTYLFVKEEWVRCKYKSFYTDEFISSLGRIYSPRLDRLLNLTESSDHYLTAYIHYIDNNQKVRRSHNIHRLVLFSFIGMPPKNMIKPEADHIDGHTCNNALYNLQWIPAKENLLKRKNYNMPDDETIIKIAKEIEKNELSPSEIARKYGVKSINSYMNKERRYDILKDFDFSHYDHYAISRPYRIPDETKKKMLSLMKQGKYNPEIIKELNLPNTAPVKDALVYMRRKNNIYTECRKMGGQFTIKETPLVDEFLKQGLTGKEIATKFNKVYTKSLYNFLTGRKEILIRNGQLTK